MTSWHNTDIHTNTVRTNFNHFSTLPQNLVLLWLILFEKYFFKHSNPVSSVVSEIKSGVRGSYAAEKVGILKVKEQKEKKIYMYILFVQEAKESIVELMGLDYVQLVTTLLEKLVEKPPKTRHLLGQLLMMLVADKIITTADLIKGSVHFCFRLLCVTCGSVLGPSPCPLGWLSNLWRQITSKFLSY